MLFLGFSVPFMVEGKEGQKNKAEGKGVPTFEEILGFQYPRSPEISPDGEWVLYTVNNCDMEENEYRLQIWLVGVDQKEPRQMTFVKKSAYSPQWHPGSRMFAFLSAREEKPQIYIMSAFGGEARPLSESKTGVRDFKWSPDGKFIAYTATDEGSKEEKEIEKKYGKFEVFNQKVNNSHLWILDVETREAEKVVDRADLNITDFQWSPCSKRIALVATPDPRPASRYSKTDIYLLELEDKKIDSLVKQKGPDDNPSWSDDGKRIAFNSARGSEDYFRNTHICMVPVIGGKIVDLTPNFDESASLIEWKGKNIWFYAYRGMTRLLFKLEPFTKEIIPFTQGEHTNGLLGYGSSLSHEGDRIAFDYQDARHYPAIYVSGTKKYRPIFLTNQGAEKKDWVLGTKEAITWKSKDGTEITGVMQKPADFDPQKKYPLLVVIHGGPTSISVPTYYDRYGQYYPLEQWLAKGAVILEPNYRGSDGFGEEFRKLNYRNMGIGDYWDVISGVDHLISLGFVDENRLGAMGWSQGGYISAFITTYSDRFKAVSVGAGISDWVTYYVNTDIPPFTRIYLGATPWDDEEIYKKTSPMTYINNAKTPTLIQHGEFDKRVPIPNAHKLYRGLKDKGIPVKFIIYKGFGHGISKPKEKLAVLTHNFEWFNYYIWGEEFKKEEAAK